MTTDDAAKAADPLAVLEAALLERARRDADAAVAAAEAEADRKLLEARTEADEMLTAARAKGAADGASVLASARARAEREAGSVLLAAQQAAHNHARQAARDAVAEIRHDPAYPAFLEALRATARCDLGAAAVVTELPAGGLVAEVAGRRIEYSLADLADDVMDRMTDEVEGLWAP